jgi:hypothetical protein
VSEDDNVSEPGAAASTIRESVDPGVVDEMQTLRAGLELARASHLTMLRLQLALHKSNRRTAMQALDNLLEIDAEMEGLAATLGDVPTQLAKEAALFGFIGFQKEAIAAEKHVLAQGDLRPAAEPVAVATADDEQPGDTDVPAQSLMPDEEAESADRAGGGRWPYVLAIASIIIALGCVLLAVMWPALSVTLARF